MMISKLCICHWPASLALNLICPLPSTSIHISPLPLLSPPCPIQPTYWRKIGEIRVCAAMPDATPRGLGGVAFHTA